MAVAQEQEQEQEQELDDLTLTITHGKHIFALPTQDGMRGNTVSVVM